MIVRPIRIAAAFLVLLSALGLVLLNTGLVQGGALAQQPTVSIPTVTGTPYGAYIIVNSDNPQINVRSLPDALSTKVGVLLAGQQAPAKGKYESAGGLWILIEYPGIPGGTAWVYSVLVTVHGELPLVEPPPTVTPLVTATIDPTLAAQFIITIQSTRLSTYTPPPPLVIPTMIPEDANPSGTGRVPIAFIILGVGSLGIFLGLLSLIRGK
jgi:hypothetical protein